MMFLIYILLLVFSFDTNFLIEDLAKYDGEYIVYTNTSYDIELLDVIKVDNFNGQIFKTDIKNYRLLLNSIDHVSSETVVLNNVSLDVILKKLNATVKEKVKVDNVLTLYNCYSNKFSRMVDSYNYKINIQIAVSNNLISVGYPILVDY